MRAFAQLRSRLLPYLEACAREAAEAGVPMLRPLLVDFPADPVAWRVDLQYLLGPLLLVAPVFDDGEERLVYLPAGDWWDLWDDHVHRGPAFVRLAAPLDRLPVLVRGDSVLPLAPALPHTEAGPWDPLGELERRAIRHAAWLHRAATFDSSRRPTLTLSAEFVLELALTLRELVAAGRRAA